METLDVGNHHLLRNETLPLWEPPRLDSNDTTNSTDLIDVSLLPNDARFAYVMYIIFTLICLVTTFVFIWITIKVVKKVGRTDTVIPLMLVMLQLSAISKSRNSPLSLGSYDLLTGSFLITTLGFVLFFIYQCRILRTPWLGYEPNTCLRAIIISISTLFLALAVLLNINKWIYFTLRI